MNIKYLIPVAALASFGLLSACSESASSSVENSYEDGIGSIGGIVASNTSFSTAKVKLSNYARSVANEWTTDTTTTVQDTVSSFDASNLNGGNFAPSTL